MFWMIKVVTIAYIAVCVVYGAFLLYVSRRYKLTYDEFICLILAVASIVVGIEVVWLTW